MVESEIEFSIVLENSTIQNLGVRMEGSLVGKDARIVRGHPDDVTTRVARAPQADALRIDARLALQPCDRVADVFGLIERIETQTKLDVSLAQLQQLAPRNMSNAAVFATSVSTSTEPSLAFKVNTS